MPPRTLAAIGYPRSYDAEAYENRDAKTANQRHLIIWGRDNFQFRSRIKHTKFTQRGSGMSSYHALLTSALFIGLIQPAFAIPSRLSHSNLSATITPPIIVAIYPDRFGFLWIGTQEGLYKFDGSTHIFYDSADNNRNVIQASDIRGISEDREGNLLVATFGGGLLKLDRVSNRFVSITQSNSAAEYTVHLHVSRHGNIWLGTKDRVIFYNSESKEIDEWLATQQVEEAIGTPYVLVEDDNGSLLVGSGTGLSRISVAKKDIFRYDLTELNTPGGFGVTAVALEENGNLLIGTNNGWIGRIDGENHRLIAQAQLVTKKSLLISSIILNQ